MLNRQAIIEKTMLTLGVVQKYNDNSNRFRAIADVLLENIINEMAHNRRFQFNIKSAKLNYFQTEHKVNGEYKYNKPYGLLNIVYPQGLRVEGEYIYSENKDEVIRYNQNLSLDEYPENLINYMRYALAYELCLTYPEFRTRQQDMYGAMLNEESKITANETPKTRDIIEETLSIY